MYLNYFTCLPWLGWGGCIQEVDNITAKIMSVPWAANFVHGQSMGKCLLDAHMHLKQYHGFNKKQT